MDNDNKMIAKTQVFNNPLSSFTGGNESPFKKLMILQDTKQTTYFKEGTDLSTKDLGKLFVTKNGKNEKKDLTDTFSGTLLKMEYGHTIFTEAVNDDGETYDKFVGGVSGTVRNELKEKWSELNKDMKLRNEVFLLFLIGSFDEVEDKIEKGTDLPFVSYVIKKSGWGGFTDIYSKMNDVLTDTYPDEKLNKTADILFKFNITTTKEEKDKYSYFIPQFDVELNDINEIGKIMSVYEGLGKFKYYTDTYQELGLIDPVTYDPTPQEVPVAQVVKEEPKTLVQKVEEEFDDMKAEPFDDDLPF